MPTSGDHTCRVYEQLHGVLPGGALRPGGLALTEHALELCSFPADAVILDVGCGPGITLSRIAALGARAFGVDPSAMLLECGRAREPHLPLIRAIAEHLPVKDNWADGVLCECALSVTSTPAAALTEFHRVLKRGARLILSDVYARDPAGIGALRRLPLECCLQGALDASELTEKLRGLGFEIQRWEDHSDLFARFTASLVWACGSTAQVWQQASSGTADPARIAAAIAEARPGYFLLIAAKAR